ncbi:MAG TPA: ABC transporter permease, partial [Chitinophagaceae bacterium]|nr:ABC transporter permease [Chitinophagaceae bacterium]
MLKHYLKIVARSLRNNKGFSFINIFGLAIGMACSLLIFLYVTDETSYDRFHKDAANIHRVVKDFINDDGTRIPDATTPAALSPAMQREIPEVVSIARVFPNWGGTWLVKYGDKKLSEEKVYRVDSSFFDVFTFPFTQGNAKTAFNDVHSVVITESIAKKYFGKDDPIGKVLHFDPMGDMTVSGVVKDVPSNSHFHFDFLISWRQLPATLDNNWGGYNYYTYVKVKPGTNIAAFNKKIQGVYERNQNERYSAFYTQPITSIHLSSHLKWELEPNGDQTYVYIFTIIGIFIILIAAINYINLSTAKSSIRAKEIGIRKVSGAVRGSLVRQFLMESVVICLVAAVLAVIISQLLLPLVNSITQKQLTVVGNPVVLFYLLLAALFVGLVAGIVPALYLSSFKPIMVLKGFKLNESGALNLRKTLVVVQFTISIVLIIGALVIAQQISYIQSAKLGFNKDQVLIVRNGGYLSTSDRSAFLNSAKQLPGVKNAAASSIVLGGAFSTARLSVRGSDKEQQLNFSNVGYDFFDVTGMEMKEGRGFSSNFPADTMNNGVPGGPLIQDIGGLVINETAVKDFHLDSPVVGKQLLWSTDSDTSYFLHVVGVVKDFHFTSLRNEIKPFGFICVPSRQNNFTLKLSGNDIKGTIAQLEKLWGKFSIERPFDYVFLDESFAKLYASEERFQKAFISLVVLGIMIACLGLLGLATYAAQQRVKEIGIRKTLGASVMNVVGLLSKDFLKLVVIALVIAVPIAWYAMNKWLQDFHYRISIQWWIFIIAGVLAIVIAFATISFQTIRAATANPV